MARVWPWPPKRPRYVPVTTTLRAKRRARVRLVGPKVVVERPVAK